MGGVKIMKYEDRIKKIRLSLVYNQQDFAALLGMTGPAYNNTEKGVAHLKNDALSALAKMGINLNWLIAEQGEMKLPEPGSCIECHKKDAIISYIEKQHEEQHEEIATMLREQRQHTSAGGRPQLQRVVGQKIVRN
jgi:transcriptional regulator with XRE-family HTH domain